MYDPGRRWGVGPDGDTRAVLTPNSVSEAGADEDADASAATPAPPVVVSRGGTKPGRRVNSLARFVRNGPKKNNDTTKTP